MSDNVDNIARFYTPIKFLEEIYHTLVVGNIGLVPSEVHVLVYDDGFYGFDCIITISSIEKPVKENIYNIEGVIFNYCVTKHEIAPMAYAEPLKKGGYPDPWITKIHLNTPHKLFNQYVNYCKIKNRLDKIEKDFKFLVG